MKKGKIIKLIIIVIAIIIGIIVGNLVYKNFIKSKFKKILTENDANNYELIEKYNDEEITTKVRDKILVSEDKNNKTWLSELDKKRVIIDINSKIAILTENDDELKLNSLNYTYIDNYFNDKNQKFKYLGKENNYYKFQFTNKNTGNITCFYLNKDNNIIEKMIETVGESERVITFKVKKDSVSKKEVEYPNLDGYEIVYSSSSK